MKVIEGLKYTKEDEWVKVEGNIVTIGVTDYAQDHLSDVVYVEYPVEKGDQVSENDVLVTLESVKAAADITSPVSGEIVEVNEELAQNTSNVNADPYGAAWMVKIKADSTASLNSLLDAAGYEKFCSER